VAPVADCDSAKANLRTAMMPAERKLIISELTRLRMVTKSRNGAEEDLAACLAAYADELIEYPRDVLVSTLRHFGITAVFWPALAEIVSAMDATLAWRRNIAEVLAASREPDPPEPSRVPPTDEEIDEIFAKHGVPRPARLFPRRTSRHEPVRSLAEIHARMKTARPAVETDPAVRAMVEAWNKELGL